ncbi:MAG: 50S ribosomal protein L18 [Thermodesulfobacteriota bacterium]|nr:50S ribosomal protein L18 [Thermodesulfobacteriota bacterium]
MGKNTVRDARLLRKARIRNKIVGTSERPRLSVFRGNRNIYCQLIDDARGLTLASASSLKIEQKGYTVDMAALVGRKVAEMAREKGIERIVFDKGSYKYHGKVKALADAARAGGLKF